MATVALNVRTRDENEPGSAIGAICAIRPGSTRSGYASSRTVTALPGPDVRHVGLVHARAHLHRGRVHDLQHGRARPS